MSSQDVVCHLCALAPISLPLPDMLDAMKTSGNRNTAFERSARQASEDPWASLPALLVLRQEPLVPIFHILVRLVLVIVGAFLHRKRHPGLNPGLDPPKADLGPNLGLNRLKAGPVKPGFKPAAIRNVAGRKPRTRTGRAAPPGDMRVSFIKK